MFIPRTGLRATLGDICGERRRGWCKLAVRGSLETERGVTPVVVLVPSA